MLRSNILSEKLTLSVVSEQQSLRRAEARVASAGRAVRRLADIGESMIARLGAEGEPAADDLRREYARMLDQLEALAEAVESTHHAADHLARTRGAIIHESGGMPKRAYREWLTGRLYSDSGKFGLTGA